RVRAAGRGCRGRRGGACRGEGGGPDGGGHGGPGGVGSAGRIGGVGPPASNAGAGPRRVGFLAWNDRSGLGGRAGGELEGGEGGRDRGRQRGRAGDLRLLGGADGGQGPAPAAARARRADGCAHRQGSGRARAAANGQSSYRSGNRSLEGSGWEPGESSPRSSRRRV